MAVYLVLEGQGGELARKRVNDDAKDVFEGDFMTPLIDWICEENLVINIGDTIKVVEV